MRRLWSYVILTGASLVLMGSTFTNVFRKSTSNIEYSDGREMVFRISNKDETELEEKNVDGKSPAEVITTSMMKRLDAMKVTNYEVATVSYDTVKVTLKQDTNENYENIQKLMTFNGSLALSSRKDGDIILDNSKEEEKFITGDAYMETKNDYPSINIPVGGKFKDLYDVVKQHKEDNDTDAAETSGEGEEATTSYYLYLWHDYNDGDLFSQTISGNENYDSRIAEKVFMNFDISELIKLEEDGKSIDKLTAFVNVQDVNDNSKYESSEVKKAFDTARYYVSLINSGSLDYKVTFIYSNNVPAVAEQLVSTDGVIQWSSTLRATIVCVVILSLLLAVFYRLSSLSVITTSIASVYAGVGAIILFSAEFNAAGLIGLCAVAIASLVSGVIYLTKLKEESYRGRTLKKANSEAAKKALLPVLDVNVVLIIIGVFAYIMGGTIMRSFAIITVLGGLASLILNLLVFRGLMWLVTNTTKLQGRYEMFGIESKYVPNLLKEEKQTFYGAYADKDFTKKKKPIGAIAGLLFVAGLTGMIVFGVVGKGVVYNNGGTAKNSEIYVETTSKHTLVTEDEVRKTLANVYTYDKDEAKAKSLNSQVSEVVYKTREDIGEDEDDKIYYTYYTVKLSTRVSENANAYYVEKDEEGKEVGDRIYAKDVEGGISTLITDNIKDKEGNILDSEAKATVKEINVVSTAQPEFAPVIWGTLVGIAVSAFYLLIRYRLSRGIAAFIIPTGVSAIVAGFFAYTRLAVTNYAVVVIPVVAFIS